MSLNRWVILLAVPALVLASCSESPTSPNNSDNLIYNSGFRSGNSPSLAGWTITDTAWVKVVANAPLGSGSWSLWLAPQFGPAIGGLARTSVTGQSGRSVYTLSGWERNFANGYWGEASVSQIRNGSSISYKSWQVNDTTWGPFAFFDTLDVLPTDTLVVGFSAASYAVFPVVVGGSVDTVSSGVVFNAPALTKSGN